MQFLFSEQQLAFQETVRRFAADQLAAKALERAHDSAYPWEVASLLAANGLLGIMLPEADGGQGGTLIDAVIAVEQIASVCPRSADPMQTGNFGPIRAFAEFATAEQKRRFLPDLLSGRKVIALAMSEPEAGSSVTDLVTSAVPDGDGFRINGTKVFSSQSDIAELFLVYVRFGPGLDGIGSVLVERGRSGFTLGQPVRYLNDDVWRQLYFDDCRIPAENVLLGKGGFKKQMAAFNIERIGSSARALAIGQLAFNVARDYVATRLQFGRPLCEFQGLQWKFAELALKLDSARLLLYRAASNAADGLPSAQETAMAKLACTRVGFEASNEAIQMLGGFGFTQESIVEHCMRRTRAWMIAGGTDGMMLNRVAEGVFGRSFQQRPPRAAAGTAR